MASYQARQRDPLLDQNMQAMLERRGRELLGLVLVAVALAFVAMLWTYSPDDPGWMVATDEPAKNALGRFGAALASTLIIIGGKGAWSIPLILMVWGGRFLTHRGADRVLGRIVFAVIAVAMCSVYAATLVPGQGWPHSFGLGGLFGDTVLGALIGIVPGSAGFSLKLVSLLLGIGVLAMLLFVTGFDRAELRQIGRFLMVGTVIAYSQAMAVAGRGAQGTARAALAMQERRRMAHANRAEASVRRSAAWEAEAAPTNARGVVRRPLSEPPASPAQGAAEWGRPVQLRAEPRYAAPLAEAPHYAPPKEKLGLLARVPGLMRRLSDPEPELVEPTQPDYDGGIRPDEDRIRARISDAIKSRIRNPGGPVNVVQAAVQRREPALRRGPQPLIADLTPAPRPLPVEPPLTPTMTVPVAPIVPPLGVTQRQTLDMPQDHSLPELEEAWEDGDNMFHADGWMPEAEDYVDEDDIPTPARPLTADRRPVVQHVAKKPAAPSRQAMAEAQPRLRFEEMQPEYELPPLSLLAAPSTVQRHTLSDEALEENARMLENVLDDYGVKGEIVSVRPGPVVTMYELEPAPGLKASRVIGLADDIARSMSALSARVSTVPGRTVIGIELPNAHREKVVLREILSARDFGDSNMRLPLALGKDIGGEPLVANLAKMPHLLIAGTTGSGKSVAINTMILSLLYKLTPEECRLIMIDPKMLELSVYDGIPHLLSPVVTDPKKAVVALKWVVGEMEERYRKMSKMGVRNIEGYNGRVREALAKGELFKRTIQTGFDEDTGEPVFETEEFAPVALPYIVVIVDEMADLMMVAGKEIEACIQRLAQMARASGIHLIMATQRPSVDVITGTIKANFPTRISFQVTSKIDSRTILGEQGAEQLLGMGDMLYMAGGAKITRIHGPFVSDEEVEEIVNHLKSFGPPQYMSGVVEGPEDDKADDIDLVLGLGGGGAEGSDEALYDQAVAIVARDRKCSTSYIQRKLGIGYNKAARLVEQMEEEGVVTRANHVGKREILIPEA
ncbi:DNA translocase FtsK [Fuscovulum ytuae]|uniref:DNA translocase FtsK n=1 Tax=Fuscovulum ytuae TaxID=3042299 RepID=A0ABY8Q5C5_9RHOB|nr:DNA translocase FtsK 4TM domain-containing protein [Fuscovulum sp. YMD61]WGV15377.1 DNA translocase FtsK 4TM domain-containing protein [Fuscovulum sp. YMD61]